MLVSGINPITIQEYNMILTKFDINQLDDIQLADVDIKDYPDFCDAYVESASYKGMELTDKQLEELNMSDETREWVNANAYESLF